MLLLSIHVELLNHSPTLIPLSLLFFSCLSWTVYSIILSNPPIAYSSHASAPLQRWLAIQSLSADSYQGVVNRSALEWSWGNAELRCHPIQSQRSNHKESAADWINTIWCTPAFQNVRMRGETIVKKDRKEIDTNSVNRETPREHITSEFPCCSYFRLTMNANHVLSCLVLGSGIVVMILCLL